MEEKNAGGRTYAIDHLLYNGRSWTLCLYTFLHPEVFLFRLYFRRGWRLKYFLGDWVVQKVRLEKDQGIRIFGEDEFRIVYHADFHRAFLELYKCIEGEELAPIGVSPGG